MSRSRREAVYDYTHPLFGLMAQKVKYRRPDGDKFFGWQRVTGWVGEEDYLWAKRLGGWQPGLYRADELAAAAPHYDVVWLCEGEKDADALHERGYLATSVPNGAGSWDDAWADQLRGFRQVIVVADDDEEGRGHAARVADRLLALLDCAVGVVLPAEGHKDAAEHLAAGKGRADWRRPSAADVRGWLPDRPVGPTDGASAENQGGPVDAEKLLLKAFATVSARGRNQAGFDLAQQLRDAGMPRDEAEVVVVDRYLPAANALGAKGDPYTAREARESVRQAYSREARDPAPGVVHGYRTTDAGNAQRFAAQHGEDVLFNPEWNQWLVWDGTRWAKDQKLEVLSRAKATAESIYAEALTAPDPDSRAKLAKWAAGSEKRSSIESMIALARSEVPVAPDQLDADPWLFNCANGVVDLRTGELMPHSKELLLTKASPIAYDADARAPRWEAFLARVLPDVEVRHFVQKAIGYSLTGDTREQVLFMAYGSGQNGKSTFLEAVRTVTGDYAQNAPTEMLLNKRNGGGIPNDVARLRGARFVTAVETAKGRRMEESLVKQLTGGDTVTARYMRAEFFEFTPVAKIWMATNHKPIITGTDEGIWRRIRLIGFTVRIPPEDLDPQLPHALAAEAPGILAWAVRGALTWQREGLAPPEAVVEATSKYRADMDVLGDFLSDRCVVGPGEIAERLDLFNAYEAWCMEANLRPPSDRGFYEMLRDRGFEEARKRRRGAKNPSRVFLGVGLADE